VSPPLEDYALLSDMRTGPLVSRDGSIDWLCLPRFDSPAVFCALLGDADDGRWQVSVAGGEVVSRRYLPSTFVVETIWRAPTGQARTIDFLPPGDDRSDLVRRVECLEGSVTVEHDLRLRFDYARATPWLRRVDDTADGRPALLCVAGPDALLFTGPLLNHDHPVPQGEEPDDDEGARARRLTGTVELAAGGTASWDLTWFPAWEPTPEPPDPDEALDRSVGYWRGWAAHLTVRTDHDAAVLRSLLVLRALTHRDTGGIVAAATASLPEEFGGSRNWDYRYTWLRDAALTIEVMVAHGFTRGATQWRDWLLRAVAGDAEDLRIMYGLGGERELDEKELPHLAGYEGSRPVRIGNGAADQYQADVPGEVMIALAALRNAGVAETRYTWRLQKEILRYCERNLDCPDHGIWEMRGDLHFFTHGRVMLWAAFDQGVRAVEQHGLDGDADRWRELRERLRREVEDRGWNERIRSFTQTYDADEVDASLLQLPHTGFVTYDDPRMLATVARIENDLLDGAGLLHRYRTAAGLDGLTGEEYPFLICSFWLVEQYAHTGRTDEARSLMKRLVGLANDVGLLSEEYDPATRRLAGNFPQAFSHLGLIRGADALRDADGR
jgi:GH15 family glucan-1,4-alpha-glucosidase